MISTSLDRSLKKSEIENSWLRANQDRRYRIRGLEQDYNSLNKNETESVENNEYINEPTYGNHSGIINLLKIKRPHYLEDK